MSVEKDLFQPLVDFVSPDTLRAFVQADRYPAFTGHALRSVMDDLIRLDSELYFLHYRTSPAPEILGTGDLKYIGVVDESICLINPYGDVIGLPFNLCRMVKYACINSDRFKDYVHISVNKGASHFLMLKV